MQLSPEDRERIRKGLKLLEEDLERKLEILRNPEPYLITTTEAELKRVRECLERLEVE